MKKLFMSLCVVAAATTSLIAHDAVFNAAELIPSVTRADGWKKIPDVAQYKEADWSHVIGKAENVNLAEAKKIANSNPEITYFFYVKGHRLVLEDARQPATVYRIFYQGDAVFFTGEPWWGSAPRLADGYIKR